MTLSSLHARKDGEYNGVGLARKSSTFVKQDTIPFGSEPFENL